jgi:hypothetical protein
MNRHSADDRRPLVRSHHRKRSVWIWVIPLGIILAVIYSLPRLLALLES